MQPINSRSCRKKLEDILAINNLVISLHHYLISSANKPQPCTVALQQHLYIRLRSNNRLTTSLSPIAHGMMAMFCNKNKKQSQKLFIDHFKLQIDPNEAYYFNRWSSAFLNFLFSDLFWLLFWWKCLNLNNVIKFFCVFNRLKYFVLPHFSSSLYFITRGK